MLTKKIVPMTAKEGNTKEGYQGSQETPFLIKDGGELGILRVGPLAQLRGFLSERSWWDMWKPGSCWLRQRGRWYQQGRIPLPTWCTGHAWTVVSGNQIFCRTSDSLPGSSNNLWHENNYWKNIPCYKESHKKPETWMNFGHFCWL